MSYTPTEWKTGDIVSSAKLNKIETELVALDTDKANIDGYYEGMTVGNAEQLVATVGVNDSVPFNFRTTGGSADVGDRKTMEVVGGTLAWNQMVKNGNFSEGSGGLANWSINGTASASNGVVTWETPGYYANFYQINFTIIAGHKYLVVVSVKTTEKVSLNFNGQTVFFGHVGSGSWETVGNIIAVAAVEPGESRFRLMCTTSGGATTDILVKDAMVFDLTQMFGSTIADYIYSLEQANAGAGVAWFKTLFPAPYYAYNEGELMSVKTSAYKSVGFNQWDGEYTANTWLDSYTTGETASQTGYNVTDYIPVLPDTVYYRSKTETMRSLFYDENKNAIPQTSWADYITTSDAITFTTPANARYARFTFKDAYIDTFILNLHWDGERDGEYEPYETHTYALDSDLELRGIPKLDADNQLYYDGDIYESDGAVTRKYGVYTFTGEENFGSYSSGQGNTYYVTLGNYASNVKIDNKFRMAEYETGLYGTSLVDKSICGDRTRTIIFVRDDSCANATALMAKIAGMKVQYELATPTTEAADPFQTPQIVNDFGTEEFVDSRTIPIPAGHNSKYQANLRAKLEMAPNSPSGDGDYIVRQSGGQNTYVPITFPADELPAAPTTDGNYVLKCTVSSGTATFSWEAQT